MNVECVHLYFIYIRILFSDLKYRNFFACCNKEELEAFYIDWEPRERWILLFFVYIYVYMCMYICIYTHTLKIYLNTV